MLFLQVHSQSKFMSPGWRLLWGGAENGLRRRIARGLKLLSNLPVDGSVMSDLHYSCLALKEKYCTSLLVYCKRDRNCNVLVFFMGVKSCIDLLHTCLANNHATGAVQLNTCTFTLAECTHSLNSAEEMLRGKANHQKIKSIHLPETHLSSEKLNSNLMKPLTSEIIALSSAGLFDIAPLSTLQSQRFQGAVGGRRCDRRRASTLTLQLWVWLKLKRS